jgi:hypothetical protein
MGWGLPSQEEAVCRACLGTAAAVDPTQEEESNIKACMSVACGDQPT